ncbi:Hypothetical protein R9X50_00670000 [Acrodontium crateriforme]|uniref:Uncharacterized protein n=1 Tax=Acrodontium crateriforme TaxID=150365 RepID=A0AAQ3MAA2_9PEZI|nr:Hypothetical protein R9X50_00670000 [Acrodontium crateriforme]
MARYPNLEDYKARGNYNDGLKRVDELLKNNPSDVRLLTTKLELTYATHGDGSAILHELANLKPPVLDLSDIVAIEEAVVEGLKDVFPSPQTAGPDVAKLYDGAIKSSSNTTYKVDVLSLRFSRAILHDRKVDAQQSLIQLKALQPKNRTLYMAHAALTQMLSTSNDDLQSKLAITLARKAVKENFDEDKALDCRVVGQIFAIQGQMKDLNDILDRASFKESKQVYTALKKAAQNGIEGLKDLNISETPVDEMDSRAEAHRQEFATGIADLTTTQDFSTAVANPSTSKTSVSETPSRFEILKQEFSTAVANPSTTPDEIIDIAVRSIGLFHSLVTSSPDARSRSIANTCFLAISALIQAFTQSSGHSSYLLQAAFLAETLLRHNPHIHEARLILVYLYMRLGLGSLAMRMFDSLSVKEVQHDTIGHVLFTRLSTTHPHATGTGRKDTLDNFNRLTHAMNVYTRCEDRLADTQADVISHGQSGMLFELQELRDSLASSFSRRITVLELRRIARLTEKERSPVTIAGPNVTANWTMWQDNRDFNAAFNYGCNVERTLHGTDGVVPGKTWLLFALAADTVWNRGTESSVTDPSALLSELENVFTTMSTSTDDATNAANHGLTLAELKTGQIAYHALQLSTPDLTEQTAKNSITAIFNHLPSLSPPSSTPSSPDTLTTTLQATYTNLDTLRLAHLIANPTSTFPSQASSHLREIQNLAKKQFDTLQMYAKERRAEIKPGTVKDLLRDEKRTWQAISAFGGDDVHVFSDDVARAAREGWEGVGKISLA